MMLIDTSVAVQLLRDDSGLAVKNWRRLVARQEFVISRLTQLELLQGARNAEEWGELESYLDGQAYVEASEVSWHGAARIFFELRRNGVTVRSALDCLIAQVAIENRLTLVHNDRDYDAIARLRPSLRQRKVDLLA